MAYKNIMCTHGLADCSILIKLAYCTVPDNRNLQRYLFCEYIFVFMGRRLLVAYPPAIKHCYCCFLKLARAMKARGRNKVCDTPDGNLV